MTDNERQPQEAPQEEELRVQLADKDKEIEELRERMLRLRADLDNYRKQVGRDMETLARRVSDQEILDFLPVYDSMEAAFRAFRRAEDAEAFVEGSERIFAQFAELLERKGCRAFSAKGTKFDPAYHEVLIVTEAPEERDTILEEFERGWCRGDRVLRPAKVKASLGPKGGEVHGTGQGACDRD